MTYPEYARCARKFLADSDREFAAGERKQASEKLTAPPTKPLPPSQSGAAGNTAPTGI